MTGSDRRIYEGRLPRVAQISLNRALAATRQTTLYGRIEPLILTVANRLITLIMNIGS